MRCPRPSRLALHRARCLAWSAQLPLIAVEGVRESVPYLVFLSLAALIESSGTDWDQARQDRKREREGRSSA